MMVQFATLFILGIILSEYDRRRGVEIQHLKDEAAHANYVARTREDAIIALSGKLLTAKRDLRTAIEGAELYRNLFRGSKAPDPAAKPDKAAAAVKQLQGELASARRRISELEA